MSMETLEKPRLESRYRQEIVPAMMKEFGYKNVMQVPRLIKVVVNMGVKEGKDDIKVLEQIAAELTLITGQKPLVTKAKKSISALYRDSSLFSDEICLHGISDVLLKERSSRFLKFILSGRLKYKTSLSAWSDTLEATMDISKEEDDEILGGNAAL